MPSFVHKNSVDRDPAVDAYVRSFEGSVGDTLAMLVALIRAAIPEHTEVIYHGVPVFCVERRGFCFVSGHSKHANLGFSEGARLDDPDGLIEGTGKNLRHVKVRGVDAPDRAKLEALVRQAAARMASS